MISSHDLVQHLQQLLNCERFNDYAPNGLQVEGKTSIERLCTAVTASEEAIIQAIECNADALLVHHGYFWRGEEPTLTGMKRRRIQLLLNHDINLLAYHLPLDCHPIYGNNACLGELLGIHSIRSHRVGNTDNLLWSGRLKKAMSEEELALLIAQTLNRTPLSVSGSNKKISSIAWCSGGAQDYITEAYALGVDAYLSGEISERTYYQAKELGMYYFSCGHHATERYGVQALGQYLASTFSLAHLFLDSNNPV